MALINHIDGGQSGVLAGFISHFIDTHPGFSLGYCVGQIHCIFTLSSTALQVWFSGKKLSPLNGLLHLPLFAQNETMVYTRFQNIKFMVNNKRVSF